MFKVVSWLHIGHQNFCGRKAPTCGCVCVRELVGVDVSSGVRSFGVCVCVCVCVIVWCLWPASQMENVCTKGCEVQHLLKRAFL